MSETDTLRGELRVLGLIHGGAAINTILTYYENPDDWVMKQFVSEAQLHQFARDEMLAVRKDS